MIDIKMLDKYSRFVNLKQVCDLADVSYSNVKHKVQRSKAGSETRLNDREVINLTKVFQSIGKSFSHLKQINI
jgi:hypothetical protein